MFDFFKRKSGTQAGHYFLALDIGTEFVKALLCDARGKTGTVLGVGWRRQNLGEMQSGVVTDISGVIENAREAIYEAEKMAGVHAEQLVMGIAGELVKGATSTVKYTRADPHTKINIEELKNIVHKVQWKAFDQVRAQLAYESGYNEIDVKLVNAAIVDVRIDGYKVSNPVGFQGKEVVMSVFNAFAPLIHFGALQTIAAELDMDLLAITAEPYAVARCMGHEDAGNFSAIFIDIGGGTTDIAIVRDGGVEGTKMFTLGGRTFTKRLAQSLNVSFQEAEEIKLAYSSNKLEKQSHKIVQSAMTSDCEVWLTGVALTLSEFVNVDILPSQIYLCGGGSHLPEIKQVLDSKDWHKNLPFARKPQVSFLKPKHVSNIIDETKKLKDSQDITPMALANLALELAGEEKVLTKLLRKVVRLMQV
ncbi:MAG: cell division FtsA domain-containing protein [Patescibacteria group bacterium]|nr:rod shape-determining protein [Patescibacteria group bacterium]